MSNGSLDFSIAGLLKAVVDTVRNPQEGALRVIGLNMPNPVLWVALVAIVSASVVMGQGSLLLVVGEQGVSNPFLANPMLMWVIQLALLVVMIYATHFIGRKMGGTGGFNGALGIVVWLQFVLACLQVLQTAALFVAPPLADLLGFVGIALFLWLFTNFVAALHRFDSLFMVFVMIIVSTMGISLVLSIVLTILGVAGTGALNV